MLFRSKGTQARLLAQHYGLDHLESGALLRLEAAAHSALGQRIAAILATGELVPDDLLLPLIRDRIVALPTDRGFVLDGVPRTVGQAIGLEQALDGLNRPVDGVVLLTVPDDIVYERLEARQRADDTPAVIAMRLSIYHEQIAPLQEYYARRNLLYLVNGVGEEATVFVRVIDALGLPPAQSDEPTS